MNERLIDRKLLDDVSAAAAASPRLRKNHNFHAAEADASHRLLNGAEPGTYFQPHCHLDANKDESIVILRGRLGAVFFDEQGRITESALLEPGGEVVGINVPHGVFHTLVVLAPGTVFFEAKGGPYVPLGAAERASWAPGEGEPAAAEYLQGLLRLFSG